MGLGSALRDGLAAALDTDAACILTMDADFSHDPADIPRLLETMRRERAGIIQGSRYMPGGSIPDWSLGRRILSRGANLLFQWGAGGPRESTTNFRVYSRDAAALIASRARGNGYEFVAEATLLALAAGFRIVEVPIAFTDRRRGSSKMGMAQAATYILHSLAGVAQYRLRMGRFSHRRAGKGKRDGGGFRKGRKAR